MDLPDLGIQRVLSLQADSLPTELSGESLSCFFFFLIVFLFCTFLGVKLVIQETFSKKNTLLNLECKGGSKEIFFRRADGSYIYSLCSHSNNFYIGYVFKINWRPGSTPPPLPPIWQPPGLVLILSVFHTTLCSHRPSAFLLQHIKLIPTLGFTGTF